jgi:aspartate racemase
MNSVNSQNKIFGVIGGMGPLASAEFLKTIYESSPGEREQEFPIVILYSNPSFPDRTESFLTGKEDVLRDELLKALTLLREMGVSKMVICCVTIHHLLPKLQVVDRQQIISLLDVVFNKVVKTHEKHLLLCSNGTHELGIFQAHPQWCAAKDRIVLPSKSDQEQIHKMIYEVKQNCQISQFIPVLESLLQKYDAHSFIAGCTEVHLLAKHFMSVEAHQTRYGCIDPLTIIAKEIIGAMDEA